jgi:hypothetical protein
MSTEKSNDTIWNRTNDLPICSTDLNHCANAGPNHRSYVTKIKYFSPSSGSYLNILGTKLAPKSAQFFTTSSQSQNFKDHTVTFTLTIPTMTTLSILLHPMLIFIASFKQVCPVLYKTHPIIILLQV